MSPGNRVQLGTAGGTIERVRGEVAEVRFDTGARSAVPVEWLDAEGDHQRGRPSAARRERRHRSAGWQLARATRKCEECGGEFTPADARQVYCSPACRKRASYRHTAQDAPPYAGGHVASSGPLEHGTHTVTNGGLPTSTCSVCGVAMAAKRSTRRYCSRACQQVAYRERRAVA